MGLTALVGVVAIASADGGQHHPSGPPDSSQFVWLTQDEFEEACDMEVLVTVHQDDVYWAQQDYFVGPTTHVAGRWEPVFFAEVAPGDDLCATVSVFVNMEISLLSDEVPGALLTGNETDWYRACSRHSELSIGLSVGIACWGYELIFLGLYHGNFLHAAYQVRPPAWHRDRSITTYYGFEYQVESFTLSYFTEFALRQSVISGVSVLIVDARDAINESSVTTN